MGWPKGVSRKQYNEMRAKEAGAAAPPEPKRGRKNGVEKDPVSLQLLALYVCQKLGQGSLEQIHNEMQTKLGMDKLSVHALEIQLDALRKRGFLSAGHGTSDDGNRVDLFAIRNIKFQSPPEVAHYADLLPELLRTKEAEAIKTGLDAQEHKGDKKERANRLGYRDYYLVRATFKTLNPILGGLPKSPYLTSLLRGAKVRVDPDQADVFFDRDPIDGGFVISADQVAGWLRSNCRYANKGDMSLYVSTSEAKFFPKPEQVCQAVFPIISQGKGAGLAKYEMVKAGVEYTITFGVPKHGAFTPEEFRGFLMLAGLQPIRGLSPARGKRYGKTLLIGFELVKELRDMHSTLATVMEGIPEELRKQNAKFLQATLAGLKGVWLSSKAPTEDIVEA